MPLYGLLYSNKVIDFFCAIYHTKKSVVLILIRFFAFSLYFLIMSCFLKCKAFLYTLPPVMISSPKCYSNLSSMLICYTGYFSFCQSVFFRFFQKYKFLPQIAKAVPSFRQSYSYNPYSVLYNVSALCASVFMLFLPSIPSRAEAR